MNLAPCPHGPARRRRPGRRFTQGYAAATICTPTRYAMLTGECAWRQPAKRTNVLAGDASRAIDPGRRTLPVPLKEAGYATALIGERYLGLGDHRRVVDFNGRIAPGPLEVGFDSDFFIPATVDRVPCIYYREPLTLHPPSP